MARSLMLALACGTALFGVLGGASQVSADDYVVNNRVALPFPPNGLGVESLCGPDDSQDVELYDGTLEVSRPYVDANEPSTAQLQWVEESVITDMLPDHAPGNVGGRRWCTGTLLEGDIFLTAGHCLDVQNGDGGWTTPFTKDGGHTVFAEPKVLATLQVVNFKYQKDPSGKVRTPDVYPIAQLVEYRKGPDKLDYAVVKLGPNAAGKLPSATYPVAKLAKQAPKAKDLLAILQHPQGNPKKVEAGKLFEEKGTYLYYSDIDTLGGSSGSGIRDKDGAVVGVHTLGGCMPSGVGANSGPSLTAIRNVSDVLK